MKHINLHQPHGAKEETNPYKKLFIMIVLSFISMFILMYAMVNSLDNVFSNINQFYMAGLMTAPMILIEIVLMREMYLNKKLNVIFITLGVIMMITCFVFIRQQSYVADRQFLKSMIPHHGAAILMCKETSLTDPEVKELCRKIVINQQSEIDQMKAKLDK